MTLWDKVVRTGKVDVKTLSLKDLTKVNPQNFAEFGARKLINLNRDRTNLLKKL